MPLLNQMTVSGSLSWFVTKLINADREAANEKQLWEMWLHKVWDNKSFDDFKRQTINRVVSNVKTERMRKNPHEVAKTVEKSRGIIAMFNNPVEENKAVK